MTKVAVISTVKAPPHELHMFVNYHLNIGIDEIILFFDDPLDTSIDTFSQYQNVSTVACAPEYWLKNLDHNPSGFGEKQITNVNVGVQIAVDKRCGWIIHIDSDELINPLANIKHILANCSSDALRFSLMEAASEKEDYETIFSTTLFKKPSSDKKLQIAKLLGCSHSLFENEYFRGHTASKMAIRVGPKIRTYGIHGPKEYDIDTTVIENTTAIQLLHFDCVGFESWNTKWGLRINGSWTHQNMRPNRVKQLQAYIQEKQNGSTALSNLYTRFHIVPKREKGTLFLLGMLTRVKLDQSLFETPLSVTRNTRIESHG
jgi:hypothetical protein